MITNMVSERNPRDEDDYASASDSTYDEDDDSVCDEVLTVSAPILATSSSHDRIFFGSFDSPIVPVSTPSIEPKFDGFSIKIGEISCVFVDSCKNIVDCDDSVFVASEEDGYVKVLEPTLKNCDSVFDVTEASEHSTIHTTPVRLRSSVNGVATARPFASWFLVEKHTASIVFAINNHVPSFKIHDEFIVDFDPGGSSLCSSFSVYKVPHHTSFRLRWKTWDRGKKRLLLFDYTLIRHCRSSQEGRCFASKFQFTISTYCTQEAQATMNSIKHSQKFEARFHQGICIITLSHNCFLFLLFLAQTCFRSMLRRSSFDSVFFVFGKAVFGSSAFCISCSWFKSASTEYQEDNCTFLFHATKAIQKHVLNQLFCIRLWKSDFQKHFWYKLFW